MKRWYFLAALVFAAGLILVVYAISNTEALTLFGGTVQAHVIKGLGLITAILGVLTFLAVYGNSLPPNRAERRKQEAALDEDLSINDNRPRRQLPTKRTESRRSTSASRPIRCTGSVKKDGGSL